MGDLTAADLMAAYGISMEEEPGADYRGVMVVAEASPDGVAPAALAALGVGREMADALGARLEALLVGAGEAQAQELVARGADVVLLAGEESAYQLAPWAEAVAAAIQARKPEVVLWGGSDLAYDLAPRVAQRLETGLICNVAQVRTEAEDRLAVGIVPMYGGKLVGEYYCPQRRPQMLCLGAGVGRAPSADRSRQGEIERL